MANLLFTKGIEQIGLGNIDFENDTFEMTPMATTYTPDANTDQFFSDVSADVASGASDITLANVTFNIDSGNSRVELDFDNVSESGPLTFTSDKFIIKKYTGTASTEVLIGCFDFNTTQTPVASTFTYTVPAEGLFSIASS